MEIINKKLTELIPYENNPRHNEDAVEYVANSIREFGFKVPIVVDSNNVIIAGHTRYKASKQLGLNEVPCIVADDLSDEQIKAFRLADNKVGEIATWDENALGLELGELFEFDMAQFGFEDLFTDENLTDSFELPEGSKSEFCTMTLNLHEKQRDLIESAISLVGACEPYFGNENKNANGLYRIVSEWVEQRK